MKLGTVNRDGQTAAFIQTDTETRYFPGVRDVGELLSIDDWQGLEGVPGTAPDPEDLAAPVLRPGKVICVGLNYHGHAAEVGKQAPTYPTLFSKVSTALVGPRDHIQLPALSERYDWEAELTVVIGRTARRVEPVHALDHVIGYTVLNDLSVRDWQNRTSEWFQGKNFDRSTPVGPVIVTSDSFDPTDGYAIETVVNGMVEQSGITSDLIFGIPELISYISQFMTLEPGDLIATGTPAGVGFVRTPPVFLASGDRMVTRIAGIGELINEISIEDPTPTSGR